LEVGNLFRRMFLIENMLALDMDHTEGYVWSGGILITAKGHHMAKPPWWPKGIPTNAILRCCDAMAKTTFTLC
jgi:hypothetical protein